MDILQREVPLDKGFGPKGLLTRLTEHFPYSFSLYSLVFSFLMSNPFSSDLPSIYIFLLVGYESYRCAKKMAFHKGFLSLLIEIMGYHTTILLPFLTIITIGWIVKLENHM